MKGKLYVSRLTVVPEVHISTVHILPIDVTKALDRNT